MKMSKRKSNLNGMEGMIVRKPMKYWVAEEQPREKLQAKGRNALSNAELLAIILRTGSKQWSALHLAQQILESVEHDLNALGRKSIAELQKFPGIGQVKATEIAAVMELVRRRQISKSSQRPVIKCSGDAFECAKPYFHDLIHEEFYALYLSRSNQVIDVKQISKGGITGTVADGKLIFNYGLESKATGIILVHNHPSGNIQPSASDIQLTNSLKKFGAYIEVQILDHLIIAGNNYFSFADEGRL